MAPWADIAVVAKSLLVRLVFDSRDQPTTQAKQLAMTAECDGMSNAPILKSYIETVPGRQFPFCWHGERSHPRVHTCRCGSRGDCRFLIVVMSHWSWRWENLSKPGAGSSRWDRSWQIACDPNNLAIRTIHTPRTKHTHTLILLGYITTTIAACNCMLQIPSDSHDSWHECLCADSS